MMRIRPGQARRDDHRDRVQLSEIPPGKTLAGARSAWSLGVMGGGRRRGMRMVLSGGGGTRRGRRGLRTDGTLSRRNLLMQHPAINLVPDREARRGQRNKERNRSDDAVQTHVALKELERSNVAPVTPKR